MSIIDRTLAAKTLWTDPGLVLPVLLRQQAEAVPDQVFIRTTEGETVTYGALDLRIRGWMHELSARGVTAGDRVMSFLPPSVDTVAIWMAAARLGAIETPVNTAYRGNFLRHVIVDSEPKCIIIHLQFQDRFAELEREQPGILPTVIGVGGTVGGTDPSECVPNVVAPDLAVPYSGPEADIEPNETATIVYTSGTSGRSKGVIVPWAQEYASTRWLIPLEGREGDVWYSPWPLFHVSGKIGIYSTALLGGTLILREGFSTSAFWEDIRNFNVTSTLIVATAVAYLESLPESPSDSKHTLRNVFASPMPHDPDAFERRFNVRLCAAFNMTETATPITTGWDRGPRGSLGKAREGAECRVVDSNDKEVAPNETGELQIRMRERAEIMGGYWRAAEATVDAWRDLWFRTGDAVRRDEEGNFFLIDRMKDTIRRGGENISSMELEAEVVTHPDIDEAAAIGIPSKWGEHEVKLFVVEKPGRTLDPASLIDYLTTRVPRYMIPSQVAVVEMFPKTHTQRIQKAELRKNPDIGRNWIRPATVKR